jgi:hypothetical protein
MVSVLLIILSDGWYDAEMICVIIADENGTENTFVPKK